MSPWVALGRSLCWGLGAVFGGLLPVWATLIVTQVDHEISFSKIEFLKSGGMVIFAITITIAVLVDYYLSQFRFRSPSAALMFNVLFPFAIGLGGMVIHITTVIAKNESLGMPFVFNANIAIGVFAVVFCIIQKAFLVYADRRH
jgi:hypothetical protein